ncbi:MAG TPA: hypothetical protein VKI43_10645 [Vicinamibacterales bacterium]|nr:hypothetical protein [Vicinamibacterales bacterium]
MDAADLSVGPADEGHHAPSADPLWSESLYLNFAARDGVLGGFVRFARHPTRKQTEALICVYLPGGGIGINLIYDVFEQPDERTTRAGAAAFVCVDPLKHCRVTFDGELFVFTDPALVAGALRPDAPKMPGRRVRFELDAIGIHPPFFYPGYKKVEEGPNHHPRAPFGFTRKLKRMIRRPAEILSALNMRQARHYEQSMIVRGSVVIDGEPLDFDGTGHRDHSWGPRDWMPSERWRWLTGEVDGMAFNAMYLTIAGSHVTNGYVWKDGRFASVDQLRLESTFDDTGLGARTLSAELTAGGVTYAITGETLMNVPLPIVGDHFFTIYNVGRTRYRCGDRTGWGVAEFVERLDP